MKSSILISTFIIFAWTSISPAFFATWDGGGDNNLAYNSFNWVGDHRPHHGDDIIFDGLSSKDSTWDLATIYNSFTIEGNYAGTVTLDSAPASQFNPAAALILLNTLTVPDTGQTECYDSAGILMDNCAGSGQDGDYTIHPMSFTDNGDGTITDNVTGLEWQKCTNGQSGATCNVGSATGSDWATALTTCASLDLNGTGWRVPEDFELVDLVDYGRYGPAIDTTFFPNTVSNFYYWTANEWSGNGLWDRANIAIFQSGLLAYAQKSEPDYVTRCVRGTRAAKGTVFVDNGDGTITDNSTGLVWQKCSIGQINDETCSGQASHNSWDDALAVCEALPLLGYSWRLPNIKELNSISDTALDDPSINTTFFPNTVPSTYWSSTTRVNDSPETSALGVGFGFGGATVVSLKTDTYSYVRCVMGQ